jgi:hypothetical protein
MNTAVFNSRTHTPASATWKRAQLLLLVILMIIPGYGRADTGRIAFVGAIVMPTCEPPYSDSTEPITPTVTSSFCGTLKNQSIRSYTLLTASITAETGDPLLRYFFHYTTSGTDQVRKPVLVTLQYD